MLKLRAITIVTAVAVLSAAGAFAQSEAKVYRHGDGWVQETTGMITSGRTLKVMLDPGSMSVSGSPDANVRFTLRRIVRTGSEEAARREFESYRLVSGFTGDVAWIKGGVLGQRSRVNVHLDVMVPRGVEVVRLDTRAGTIAVKNVQGKVAAVSAGGSVTLDGIGGSAQVHTAGGSIEAGNIGGDLSVASQGGHISIGKVNGQVRANTMGGHISVGQSAGAMVLETMGGNIQVKDCGQQLRAETAGGSIEVGQVGGPAILQTAGGSIRLGAAKGIVQANTAGGMIKLMNLVAGARAETGGGTIYVEFTGDRGSLTDSHLENTAGDIVVYLRDDVGVTVSAQVEVARGDGIRSDFPGLKIMKDGNQFGPREVYAEGQINGGGPLLKVHATAGNIEFRRLKR